jgi:hypothetical protein
VKVAGEGDVEQSYHSPYSECTSSGLLDCDSGPRSAIYYRSPGVYGGYEYIDYWFFYRANLYSGEIDFHQGDWENVTVAPSLTTDSFDYAAFSQHGTDYAYARGVLRCENSPGSEIPAAGTCSSTSDRIDDMVAYGSHADFTTPCSQKLPTDCRNNNNFLPSELKMDTTVGSGGVARGNPKRCCKCPTLGPTAGSTGRANGALRKAA